MTDLIRTAVDRTEAAGRAKITLMAPDPQFGSEEATGTVDFSSWAVRLPKTVYVGGMFSQNGQSFGNEHDPLRAGSPLWFIEAFRGVTEARSAGIDPDANTIYEVVINLVDAARRSIRGIGLPNGYPEDAIASVHGARCAIRPDGTPRPSRVRVEWPPKRAEARADLVF